MVKSVINCNEFLEKNLNDSYGEAFGGDADLINITKSGDNYIDLALFKILSDIGFSSTYDFLCVMDMEDLLDVASMANEGVGTVITSADEVKNMDISANDKDTLISDLPFLVVENDGFIGEDVENEILGYDEDEEDCKKKKNEPNEVYLIVTDPESFIAFNKYSEELCRRYQEKYFTSEEKVEYKKLKAEVDKIDTTSEINKWIDKNVKNLDDDELERLKDTVDQDY